MTIGSLVFLHRTILVDRKPISALYVRYFAIRAPFRSKKEDIKSKKSNVGLLKNFIQLIFNNPYTYVPSLVKNEPLLIYAFVEEGNSRSQKMVDQMGMEKIGSFNTLLFSRRKPKKIVKLQPSYSTHDADQFYINYQFKPEKLHFDPENSFSFQPDAVTTIGFSVEKNSWVIHEIPGFSGWLFQHCLPYIPLLNQYFEDRRLNFITLENLYWKGNVLPHLSNVLETICAHYDVTKMLLWLDENSKMHKDIMKHGKIGILAKMMSFKSAAVYGKTFNLNFSSPNKPSIYISPLDIT